MTMLQTQILKLFSPCSALKSYQEAALEKLLKIGFPLPKDEAYQYMRLNSILQMSWEKKGLQKPSQEKLFEITKEVKGPYLVVYNGHFLPRYSNFEGLDSRVMVKPVEEAFSSYGFFFKNLLTKWLEEEKDPFALFSFVLQRDALFVYVPNEVAQKLPLTLIQISDQDESEIASSFKILSLGRKAALPVHNLAFDLKQKNSLGLSLDLVQMEEDASLNSAQLSQETSCAHLGSLRVFQKKNSNFDLVNATLGAKKTRLDCSIQLLERNCRASLSSISALKDQEEAHLNILIEHHDEESLSYQRVKNLYQGKSLGSFEGKIYVHPKAQKTNAYQLNQNCLLSDQAVCYSKPNLEIFADDVKASHGSTTGQVDPEQLFYLCSRGLSKASAKKLLLNAFCQEVVDQLQNERMRSNFKRALDLYFEEK